MTPKRWQQIREVFSSAIDCRPDERRLFLAQACSGDDELLNEVESLIAAHEKTGSFIDVPAYQAAAESLLKADSDLLPGQIVGSYEILSFISRGGMGEVYLAHDKRLSRRVALKLLPALFTKDLDRLRRFEQEARAASALNHPNIITIYEIQQAGAYQVIATEFVEGETLRQRLSYTSLTLNEALNVAIQIADALSAAHKAGIIHRDIKPENVMLRPDGYVKVLDFGLAKLSELAPATVAAEGPTRQVRTGSGIVIGTAGYMSPEQARGRDVDMRSDIFSLGAVIYEMVAHRKPFEGETPSDTLAAILKTDPPPLSHFAPEAPAELLRIVTKTLRKDREQRYQVVQDLLIDLRTLRQELEFQAKLEHSVVPNRISESTRPSVNSMAPATLAPVAGTAEIRGAVTMISQSLGFEIKRHKGGVVIALLAFALLVVGSGFALYKVLKRPPNPGHFETTKITRLTNSGKVIDATISPDGKYLVYTLSDAGKQSIWIRQVSTANDKLIVPPAPVGVFGMTISRDGNELYYVIKANLDAGTLYRIPILGGMPVKLLEKIDGPISFSPDGKRFALVRGNYPNAGESALVIANVDGSGEQNVAVRKSPQLFVPIFFTGPAWSPDGKLIAASVRSLGAKSQVILFRLEDGNEQVLSTKSWPFTARVEWLPDMSGLLVVSGTNAGTAQLSFLSFPDGQIRKVTNDLNAFRNVSITADARRLITVQSSGLVNINVVPEGDAQRLVQLPTGNIGFFSVFGNPLAWTPDGRIVFVSTESNAPDIWLMNADGTDRKQLTAGSADNFSPVVSPDGRYVVFASDRRGTFHIWRMNIDGSNAKQLTAGASDFPPAISPDGKWVVYTTLTPTKRTLWKVSIDGGSATEISDRAGANPTISPDGKLIAFLFPDSPDATAPPNRIGIIPITGGEVTQIFPFQTSSTIAVVLQWSLDGRSLLYTVNNNNVTNVWSQPLTGGPPKQVTDFKDGLMTGFAWSNDGKQLACARGILMRDAVLISDLK